MTRSFFFFGSLQRLGKSVIGWWITITLLFWSDSTNTPFFGWRMPQLFLYSYGSSDTHNSTTYRAWLVWFTLSVFSNEICTTTSSSNHNHISNNTSNRNTVTLCDRTRIVDENCYDFSLDWNDVDDHEYQYSTTDPEIGYTTVTLTHDHHNVTGVYDIDEERNVEWRCLEIFETSGWS